MGSMFWESETYKDLCQIVLQNEMCNYCALGIKACLLVILIYSCVKNVICARRRQK